MQVVNSPPAPVKDVCAAAPSRTVFIDGLSHMNPKWGNYGLQAFKVILDDCVLVQFIDVRTPKSGKPEPSKMPC